MRNDARLVPLDRIETVDIEENAAFERHRLTIIPRPAGPHRDGNTQADAGGDNPDDFGLVTRRHN
jgi:hypothetical protein